MSHPLGKSPLQKMVDWVPRQSWYKELKKLRTRVMDDYQSRNEVLTGGIITDGTATATEMMCSVTELECMLKGRTMAAVAAISDDDLLDPATTGVGTPIYEDGSVASALSLASDKTAYVTIIVCNSDDAASVDEDDNGTPLLVAVVAGTSSTTAQAQTAHLTSTEIQAALEASTEHAGVTAWAHVAQCLYVDVGGAAWTVTPTMNRNNAVSQA